LAKFRGISTAFSHAGYGVKKHAQNGRVRALSDFIERNQANRVGDLSDREKRQKRQKSGIFNRISKKSPGFACEQVKSNISQS
jgi:hypothetical protein